MAQHAPHTGNTAVRAAFPGVRTAILVGDHALSDRLLDDIIAEGARSVFRQTWSGTHKGGFMGIPPTGMRVSFGVVDIVRSAGAGSWSIGARWIAWV